MSLKNTLFMALVLGLVALFILRYEIPEGERVERERFLVRAAADQQMQRIAVSGAKGAFALRRVSEEGQREKAAFGKWQLEDLPDAVLDNSAVAGLAGAVQGFKSESVIPASEVASDLSVYGLSAPVLTIEAGEGESKTSIAFGKKNDFIDKRYARISDGSGRSDVVLTDEQIFSAASKSRDDFRDKNPLQFSDASIATITGEWKGSRVVLEQGSAGWRIKEPVDAVADQDAVLTLVRELRGFKVSRFIDAVQDPATYRLAQPDARFQVTFKDAALKPIAVAASTAPPEGETKTESLYFSLGGNTVYKVDANPLSSMLVPATQFRTRRLFSFEVDHVEKVLVSRAGADAVMLEAQQPRWLVNGQEGDPVFVLQYLNDISFLEATDFPKSGQKEFGFEQPMMTFQVTLKGSDNKQNSRTLIIGNAAPMPSGGQGFYAADGDQRELPFMISEELLQKLTPKIEALKKSSATPKALEVNAP